MALGNTESSNKIYLSISNGKVVKTGGQQYDYVDGTLRTIYQKSTIFGNETINRWYLELRDGAEIYSLCLPYSSGIFKSIILSLASAESITSTTHIRIEPYTGKNGYTKIKVYADGVKLDWVTKELPEKDTIAVGDKQVRDDSKQMALITSLCSDIMTRIANNK